MNAPGTLNHPSTRDPQLRHFSLQDPTMNASRHDIPDRSQTGAPHSTKKRNRPMQLLPESMARAHMESRLYEAESEQQALRVLHARRLQRRAERASRRAKRAMARLVM
jgi:hypothetical protein